MLESLFWILSRMIDRGVAMIRLHIRFKAMDLVSHVGEGLWMLIGRAGMPASRLALKDAWRGILICRLLQRCCR